MNDKWNLDALYPSFDSKLFKSDLDRADALLPKYRSWIEEVDKASPISVELVTQFINYLIEDTTLLRKLYAFGHLTFATDSKNTKAIGLVNKIQNVQSKLTAPMVVFKRALKDFDLKSACEASPLIKEHEFFLKEAISSTKYMLSDAEEILISKMKLTGSSAWETLQSKTASQLTFPIEIDGTTEEWPIMKIRNLAFSSDPKMRQLGYETELKAYETHAEISAAALNGIKGEVLTLSDLRGFDSPLDETLFNARMDTEILNAMIESMEEYLPVFRRYLLAKSKLLGNKGPMPFYDIYAPVVQMDQEFTIAEAKTFILKYFGDFSEDLHSFAKKSFDNDWVDFEPRAGKVGGAFCSNIPSIGESRILTNFTGKLKNVLTLAHELGHGFHGDRIMTESILNTSYPMPLAETASIFCETIVRNAVLKEADETLALSILENSLQGATSVVVDILSRFYFESQIFETRKDHPLSVDEFKEIMLDSQKKAYGNALDHTHLHPYMWLNKTHYYYASRNFYNFPYAFGLLFARGLYAVYKEKGDAFIPEYDALLKATGKMRIYDVCQLANIDPTDKAFWKASLEQIKNDVDAFESIVNKAL
ncbi:M3 family oligoendopeptidase [Fusibacter tunisiensis]|uniref:PepF/M3 family oligoendopeptidase n=1 Tax=Fusibacter tunisiensis TaxID=1008308 RepID=A0ABS2MR24_9FIRM|nr:M3 family oligoendopeptidase [Fusibacter tunisiensis]MBM7561864.1 pepF/M3 family oligoendopeptidase [Fusibacter tunisiensis]